MGLVVLITGATKGLGRECAKFLGNKGFSVYGTGRSVTKGDTLDNFNLVPCDVLDTNSVKNAIDYIIEKEGKIDVVVNSAGRGMIGSAEDATIEESQSLFDINFFGIQRVCKMAMPHMRKNGSGKIINISSLAGFMGLPYRSYYSASKYALEGWTEALRMEVKQFGIHVSLISPGDFKSDISSGRIISERSRESVYKNHFTKIEKQIDEHVDDGIEPAAIVHILFKIINSHKPKLRYVVASPFQKFARHLHYVLPSAIFEKMMLRTFDM